MSWKPSLICKTLREWKWAKNTSFLLLMERTEWLCMILISSASCSRSTQTSRSTRPSYPTSYTTPSTRSSTSFSHVATMLSSKPRSRQRATISRSIISYLESAWPNFEAVLVPWPLWDSLRMVKASCSQPLMEWSRFLGSTLAMTSFLSNLNLK